VRASVSPAPSAEELAAILAAIATLDDAEIVAEPVSKWSAFGRRDDPYRRLREERRAWPARR
jgi:hypothetical protein